MNAAARLAVLLPVLIGTVTPAASARQPKPELVTLTGWANAVIAHDPGHADDAVRHVAGMNWRSRVELNSVFTLFISALQANFIVTRSAIDDEITTFGRSVRDRVGAASFLKRAAMLHTDALLFITRFPTPPDDAPAPVFSERDGARRSVPALLLNDLVTITRDGEVIGNAKADWNLPFARTLLDVLLAAGRGRVPQEDHDFVVAWYHAVVAVLFANGNFADSSSHLDHAARVLPNDPHVLFDRATFAETFGLPVYQSVVDDPSYANSRYVVSGVPPARQTNETAERLYRRVLAVDPSYVEARVRLARLLDERGQREEAAEQITGALDSHPTGIPLFYARIIAGRIASSRGRFEDALKHYQAASELDPTAQSALVGASHAALMLSNVPDTLGPLQRLTGDVAASDKDPWLDYEFGAGRDANALITAVRSRITK